MHSNRPAPRALHPHLLAVVVAVLAVAACGGGGGEDEAGGDKPIEDQLGFDQAGIQRRQTRVENLLRDCMKLRGFDYTPVDPAAQRAALVGSATLSEEDFEKQFGYGITTLYEQRRREATTGPNASYRASLDPVQRTAYDRALYGDKVGATFAVAVDTGRFSDLGGCTRQATDEAFWGTEVLTTLQTQLDDLDARIEADARMVAANTAWSGCMRAAGFPDLARPDDVDTVLEEKLDEVVGPNHDFGVGGPASEPTYDKAALVALQRQEVAMVQADIECEEKHIADVEEKVRKEYERTFAEENAALLASVPRV